MNTFSRFEDIEAWQLSRALTIDAYTLTATAVIRKDRPLCDQIRRAAVSVQANIAEGSERDGVREFVRYLLMSRGSAGELRSHLYVARDTGLISDKEFVEVYQQAYRVSRVISALISFLRRSSLPPACS